MIENFDPMKSKMAQIMEAIANKKYKIPTGNENLRRWGIVSHAIGEVDDQIDSAINDNVRWKVVREAANFLKGNVDEIDSDNEKYVDRMLRLREVVFALSDQERSRFTDHFLDFAETTIRMRSEVSLKRMIQLRGREGDLTAYFFHDVVTSDIREHPNFDKYVHTTNALYRAGCYYDSAQDLPFDKESGITVVNPRLVNRGILLLLCFVEGVGVMKELNYPIVKSVINREKFVLIQNKKVDRRG